MKINREAFLLLLILEILKIYCVIFIVMHLDIMKFDEIIKMFIRNVTVKFKNSRA